MKYAKYTIWLIGFSLLIVGLIRMGLGNEANWIQWVSAFPMLWAFGEAVEKVQHLKRLPEMHRLLEELHEHHIKH